MRQGIPTGFILAMASRGHFVASKYTYRHTNVRKKLRRLAKAGKVVLDFQDGDSFYYTVPKETKRSLNNG